MNETDKLIKSSSLSYVLNHIYNWMPFKKTKKGIQIGSNNVDSENVLLGVGDSTLDSKNIFEVRKDGKIYVLDVEESKQKPLQDILNKKESIVIENQSEWEKQKTSILSPSNFGTIVYIASNIYSGNMVSYKAGIYIVSLNANDRGNAILSKLATTSSINDDLGDALTQLEGRVGIVENHIDKVTTNITELNDFKETPLLNSDIERITGIDINGDGRIG